MPQQPVVNDFLARLRMSSLDRVTALEEELDQAEFQAVRNGAHNGSRMVLVMLGIVEKALKDQARQSFAEAHLIAQDTNLPPSELRDLSFQHLVEIATSQRPRFVRFEKHGARIIEEHFDALLEYFKFLLRQFDIGWANRGAAQMSDRNVINATTVIGVQQGSHGSQMTANISLNFEAIQAAAEELYAELAALKTKAVPVVDMQADVDTIRAQLRKGAPSLPVLREAGRTIRGVMEGVAAGLLTPPAVAAATSLLALLGT